MSLQKALLLEKAKSPFVVTDVPIPKPGPGQISVKVISAALNPVDWKIQAFNFLVEKYPAILGSDFAGDVEEIGEGVQGFSKGDKVFCQGSFTSEMGGFQQYALNPAELVGKIPSNIDYAQAASIPLGFMTAAVGIMSASGAALNPTCTFDSSVTFSGKPAFVFGGSASVGQYAIQIFKILGFSTIITYASARHADFLKSLGATHVIDRAEVSVDSLAEVVKKITNNSPIEIAFNAVGDPDSRAACLNSLAQGGKLADVSPQAKEQGDGKKVFTIYGSGHTPQNREFGRILWKHLPRMIQDGTVVPNRVEKLPNGLVGIDDGLKKMKAHQVSGVKLIAFPQEVAVV
ncbi:GroES-like protein [Gymnopus androsaceus JB14]|uniref:GroES-like protein n=1 Tax=Gymnopus androsaceus JB14 TaxID=1447944 RepID=A0A6A4HBD9_9AGAR|nr:GroES-like protein [Gymnopus androsaceus JB14]